jgi:hypothetical protein
MASRLTVRNRILDDIDRGSAAAARVDLAILDAIKFYRAHRFRWNQRRSTFLVSSEYTSLSASFVEVDSLRIQRSASEIDPLVEKNWKWIDERKRDTSDDGEPIYFAIQYNELRLYPEPDQTYSVIMAHHYDLVASVTSLSDSFSTGWLGEGEQMIRLHAQADVEINYIKGPEATAEGGGHLAQAQEIFKQLRRRKNRQDGAGKMEAWI